jgi:hypothetical protein
MTESSRPARRRRVERGIYQQPNGEYTVCVRVDGQARFRTLEAATLVEAVRQRELLQNVARIGELPLSPRLTFAEVAARWLAEFETRVAAGERRERTLDLYRSQLHRHLLPRLGRRRLALITADDVVAVTRELQAEHLSPWTVKRILAALSCVFTFGLRRGYIATHPFQRLERDDVTVVAQRPRLRASGEDRDVQLDALPVPPVVGVRRAAARRCRSCARRRSSCSATTGSRRAA